MTTLLFNKNTLMDCVAGTILHYAKEDQEEMKTWMSLQLRNFQSTGVINDFCITPISSPHKWVFRTLVYTLNNYHEWIIFFRLSHVPNSHYLADYLIVEHPKATSYIYSQEVLDFIGTHKWRKDFGQI